MVKELLDKLGISMRVLGAMVGVSHSILSRSLMATRSIPANALLQLVQLDNLAKSLIPMVAVPKEADIEKMRKEAIWRNIEVIQVEKMLLQLQTRYQQASLMLQVLDELAQKDRSPTEKRKRLIDEQRYQAQKRVERNDWLQQKTLTIRVAVLRYEATLYQEAADRMAL